MTARLSPQRETEIRDRAEAATPGPWKVEKDYCDCSEYGCPHPPFAVAFGPFTSFENTTDRHHYDAEFTAHAREDVPALLAELAAVRAERDEARRQLEMVSDHVAKRAEFIAAINGCHSDADYWRWQGHAEARRQLAEELGLPVAWPSKGEEAAS